MSDSVSDLGPSILLSMEIAGSAVVMICIIGIPLAFLMARWKFAGRSVVEALILVPLVLPPTVVGYLILMAFGKRGVVGHWLADWFGYSITFHFEGAVLAAAVVALPMLYMPAKAAFQEVDRELEDVARMMGANRLQMFWHVSLPLARRGILSGLLLAFARAIGEFGATVMVYGWQPGRVTLPISIWRGYESDDLASGAPAVIVLGALSLALMMAYNRSTAREKK